MQLNLFGQSDIQPVLIKIRNVPNVESCNADIKTTKSNFQPIFNFQFN